MRRRQVRGMAQEMLAGATCFYAPPSTCPTEFCFITFVTSKNDRAATARRGRTEDVTLCAPLRVPNVPFEQLHSLYNTRHVTFETLHNFKSQVTRQRWKALSLQIVAMVFFDAIHFSFLNNAFISTSAFASFIITFLG